MITKVSYQQCTYSKQSFRDEVVVYSINQTICHVFCFNKIESWKENNKIVPRQASTLQFPFATYLEVKRNFLNERMVSNVSHPIKLIIQSSSIRPHMMHFSTWSIIPDLLIPQVASFHFQMLLKVLSQHKTTCSFMVNWTEISSWKRENPLFSTLFFSTLFFWIFKCMSPQSKLLTLWSHTEERTKVWAWAKEAGRCDTPMRGNTTPIIVLEYSLML